MLDWSAWSISASTAALGALLLAYVTFKILPKSKVLTFLAVGLLGGSLGYYLWLLKFGRIIMP